MKKTHLGLFIVCLILLPLLLSMAVMGRPHLWLGYWPGPYLDYAERRAEGHPRIQMVTIPVFHLLRSTLDLPEGEERAFQVPLPPRLDTADIVLPSTLPWGYSGNIIHVGPQRELKLPSQAAAIARDGDEVEIDSGVYADDVAVWTQKSLIVRGVGGHARLTSPHKIAEGKAIWVFRGGKFLVDSIDFLDAQAPDGNGAGIRFEQGSLEVRHCLFFHNQDGLLTANDPGSDLTINESEFGYNGSGSGQTHNLYVGAIRSLRVRGSYFHHANVGHLLKSRAAFNDIAYNRLTDETGGRASYELDLPAGGVARVIGNLIQQGDETENSTIISYGEEQSLWPDNRLYLASNTVVNDRYIGGTFLKVSPHPVKLWLVNNLWVGPGDIQIPKNAVSQGNQRGDWSIFTLAVRQDYRLKRPVHGLRFIPPPDMTDISLIPHWEYVQPLALHPLSVPPAYVGAMQTTGP